MLSCVIEAQGGHIMCEFNLCKFNRIILVTKIYTILGKMGERGQKAQTFSYKINKSWGYNTAVTIENQPP